MHLSRWRSAHFAGQFAYVVEELGLDFLANALLLGAAEQSVIGGRQVQRVRVGFRVIRVTNRELSGRWIPVQHMYKMSFFELVRVQECSVLSIRNTNGSEK